MELMETTLSSQLIFKGVIVTVHTDKARLINGKVVDREVVEHPGGVAVLPLHEDGTVTVVRQFRYPFHRPFTEIPAGKLEPGEDHREAILRELEEEAGLIPEELVDFGVLALSPGYSNEILHIYLAQKLRPVASHPDDDEFLNVDRVPFDDLFAAAMAGTLQDAKTVTAILKTKLYLNQ